MGTQEPARAVPSRNARTMPSEDAELVLVAQCSACVGSCGSPLPSFRSRGRPREPGHVRLVPSERCGENANMHVKHAFVWQSCAFQLGYSFSLDLVVCTALM